MQSEATTERMMAAAAHPLAELLECPPTAGDLLNHSSKCLGFDAGEVVFRQSGPCKGLYVVVSGNFQRKAERLNSHVILGQGRAGDLVELAAALGDGNHTYTLRAVTAGTLLLLLRKAGVEVKPWVLGLMLLALAFCQSVPFLLSRVWVYEIAIGKKD